MVEDVAKHFAFTNFITPILGMLREVLDNVIKPREKISFNGLGITKGKYGGLPMRLKTGLEVAQDYTVFNYRPPIPYKDLKYQDRKIMAGPRMKPAQNLFLPGHRKEKTENEPPPYALIKDNLEI